MKCPRCKSVALKEDRLREAAITYHAWACPTCKGLWLSREELVRAEMEEQPALVEFRQLLGKEKQAEPLACPECQGTLDKMTSHRDPHVTMDLCRKCEKVWLDGGELKVIQTESLLALTVGLFRWLRDPEKKQR